jgi:hypothetical protein
MLYSWKTIEDHREQQQKFGRDEISQGNTKRRVRVDNTFNPTSRAKRRPS